MELDEALKNVAVLGAAGKMGNGIALLLLQEMARLEAEATGNVGSGTFRLTLIDTNETGLIALKKYLRDQLLKYAEKNISTLRKYYAQNASLVSNEEIIDAFVLGGTDLIFFETDVEKAKNSTLIFEAIMEDADLKWRIFSQIDKLAKYRPYYFTNTSSIPIKVLNEQAQLDNRIIGFHFYNPPYIQKLLEIIAPEGLNPQLKILAEELAERLKKTVVHSHDIAGFIGNGHFIREVLFACQKVRALAQEFTLPEAIWAINRVTLEWLIRPMGIFQLIDYVGIDVVQKICAIMRLYLKDESFHDELIDRMIAARVFGGQHPDGTQKDGFFQYDKHSIKGIYQLEEKKYIPLANLTPRLNAYLGELPTGHNSWKILHKEPQKEEKLRSYFQALFNDHSQGAELAQAFLLKSRNIAQHLVQSGVADRLEDINEVLINGFYHLYGADLPWLSQETVQHSSASGHL